MRNLVAAALTVAAFPAAAQSLECARFDVAIGAEPAGYAEQCLGRAPVPQTKALSFLLGDGIGEAYAAQINPGSDFVAQALYGFNLPDFSAPERVGQADTQTANMYGMDFNAAATRLYGVQFLANDAGTRLGTFNLQTGAFSAQGTISNMLRDQITGLAVHPRTGQGWATSVRILTNNPQITEARLWRIDMAARNFTSAEPVGRLLPQQLDPVFIDLAINCEGEMYAHNITDDTLYRIDPSNTQATAVGPSHGLPANFAQGMSFDRADGELYAWIYTGGGANTFGTFDLDTGAFNALGSGPPGQWEGAIRSSCGAIPITPAALTGAWYAPYTVGQGFTIRYFEENGSVFMPWFTFSQEGGDDSEDQRWYWLAGDVPDDATELELPIMRTLGGNFDAGPSVGGEQVGTARLSFYSCTEGVLEYAFDSGVNGGMQGRMSMTRILPTGAVCTDYDDTQREAGAKYDATITGSWYDPENAGQGVEFFYVKRTDTAAGLLYGAWFTFEPAPAAADGSGQRWLTMEGFTVNEAGVISTTLLRTLGGSFDDEPATSLQSVGTAKLTSESCDRLKLEYDFNDTEAVGEFRDKSGTIELRRLGSCPPAN